MSLNRRELIKAIGWTALGGGLTAVGLVAGGPTLVDIVQDTLQQVEERERIELIKEVKKSVVEIRVDAQYRHIQQYTTKQLIEYLKSNVPIDILQRQVDTREMT